MSEMLSLDHTMERMAQATEDLKSARAGKEAAESQLYEAQNQIDCLSLEKVAMEKQIERKQGEVDVSRQALEDVRVRLAAMSNARTELAEKANELRATISRLEVRPHPPLCLFHIR